MEQNNIFEGYLNNIFGKIFYYRDVMGKVRQAKILSAKVEQTAKACPPHISSYGCQQWNNFEIGFIVAGQKDPIKFVTSLPHDCRSENEFRIPNMYTDIQCNFGVNIQSLLNSLIASVIVETGMYPYLTKHLYDTISYYAIEGESIVTKRLFIRGIYADCNSNIYITFSKYTQGHWSLLDKNKVTYPVSNTSEAKNRNTFREFTKTRPEIEKEFEENNLICFGKEESTEPQLDTDLIRAGVRQFLGADVSGVKISGEITINGNLIVL